MTLEEAKRQGYDLRLTQDSDGWIYWALFRNENSRYPMWEFLRGDAWGETEITEDEAWESMLEYLNMPESERPRL